MCSTARDDDMRAVMDSVKKAHANLDSVYCVPFGRVYRIQEFCVAAERYLLNNIWCAKKVEDNFPPRYENIQWKPYPCDTRANMQVTMEAVKEAHRQHASTYRMPFGTNTYGCALFSKATKQYILKHVTAVQCLESLPAQYVNIKWKPYPRAPAAEFKYEE